MIKDQRLCTDVETIIDSDLPLLVEGNDGDIYMLMNVNREEDSVFDAVLISPQYSKHKITTICHIDIKEIYYGTVALKNELK